MDLTQLFFLVAILTFVIVSVSAIFVAYQLYKLKLLLNLALAKAGQLVALAVSTKYAAQVGIFKTILKLLGGRGGEKDDR